MVTHIVKSSLTHADCVLLQKSNSSAHVTIDVRRFLVVDEHHLHNLYKCHWNRRQYLIESHSYTNFLYNFRRSTKMAASRQTSTETPLVPTKIA